jgi:hypothetical protein
MLSNTRFGSSPPARHVRKSAPAPAPLPAPAPAPAPTPPAPKLWKAMHHVKWDVHPESDDFFAMKNYKFAVKKITTPESLITGVNPGDRIIVQPQTMVGERGGRLKNPRRTEKFRYGTVTSNPSLDEDHILRAGHTSPLYSFSVDWDESFVPADPTIRNDPCKTFTRIN